MSIVQDLSIVALRHIASSVGYGVGEAIFNHLVERFTNHSDQMNKALQKANERAWQTLESALVGPSIFDFLKSTDDKVIAQQMQILLDNSQLRTVVGDVDFCKNCLTELRTARKQGNLTVGQAPSDELARQTGAFALLGDPQAVLDAEWNKIQQVATQLQKAEFLNLAKLLRYRPANKSSPILASSVRYFFSREIETNQQLFQGLTFAKLEGISDRQEKMLGALTMLLEQHGQRFAQAMDEVLTKLGVIEVKIDELLGLQKRALLLLEKVQMQDRELRPADSFSIRNDDERQMVKKLIEEYRKCSEEQRRRLPALLNNVGKLEVATGDFEAAQRDFRQVATLAAEPKAKAEAHFNVYQAALEQRKWIEALSALKEAVTLDSSRFAPFSFTKYEPERILGAGGFGVVFLCRHRFSSALMVVKSLRTSDLDRTIIDVFSEAKTLQQLKHPAIIQLTDCDFADSAETRPFLVMDFFNGENLETYVESQGLLSPADLLGVTIPVAEALEVAHANGILHRDVKPANILVRREAASWQVKLIDFGLAIQPNSFEGKASTQGPQPQTIASKSIAGTMHYAAPEQMGDPDFSGVAVGTYSDVYGFGKLCYYALFKTPNPDDQDKETLPDPWRKFLRGCTAQKLANRLPNFAVVLKELHDLASVVVEPPLPPLPPDNPVTPITNLTDVVLFYLKAKGITATGYESDDDFIVLADSQAVTGTVPSIYESLTTIRNNLIQQQILVEENSRLILKQTHVFASASSAASVLLGRNANGRVEWKDADGRTLKEIQNARKQPGDVLKLLESKLKRIARKIKNVERFEVIVTYHGDKESLPSYDYSRAANKDLTVAQWRDQRFLQLYPDCEVKVLLADGKDRKEAHGATRLGTVRDSYVP